MANEVALSSVVKGIAQHFTLVDGKPQMSTEDLQASFAQVCQVKQDERPDAVVEMVALAVKFQRLAGEAGAVAIAQLLSLSAGLLEDMQKAEAMFKASGVDLQQSARFLGQEASKLPVTGGKATDRNSLFSLRLNQTKPSKP